MNKQRLPHSRHCRRGAIFITALGIIVILSGLVLVFAQHMRTEALAAANRVSYVQADAVEQGAERWVQAQVDSYAPDALTIEQTPAEAIQIGDGYFWILHPDPTSDQIYSTGITDEAGKINLNAPGLTSLQLQALPGVTQEMADSILAWKGSAGGTDGATSDYYESLAEPYEAKNGAFESVEELLLIKDIDRLILYGQDLNHDGVVTDAERTNAATLSAASGGMLGSSSSGASGLNGVFDNTSRGFFNDVTAYSQQPAAKQLVNVNNQQSEAQFQSLLNSATVSGVDSIMNKWRAAFRGGRGGGGVFPSFNQFVTITGLQMADFGKIFDKITLATTPARANAGAAAQIGKVNANTATKEVFTALGLQDSDADSAVSAQQSGAAAGTTSIAWMFTSLPKQQALSLAPFVTGRSYQYSADIVAVSRDGRAFKRVRIVVDATNTPSSIVFRKDLTSLGWPLPAQIRKDMRAGNAPPVGIMTSALGSARGGTSAGSLGGPASGLK